MDLYAHKKEEPTEFQMLENHLTNVAEMAKNFALDFLSGEWAEYAGLYHDIGKAFSEWQNYLKSGNSTSINHSEAGAFISYQNFCNDIFWKNMKSFQKVISYLVSGHHAGLPDYYNGSGNSLKSILENEKLSEKCLELKEQKDLINIFNFQLPRSFPFCKKQLSADFKNVFHLWIRMLYSCLVDADFLDTEQFMNLDNSKIRGNYSSIVDLNERFLVYLKNLKEKSLPTKINQLREQIRKECTEKAKLNSGFFSLNVPTGGGKTLSVMAFALNHAIIHGKKRIIMAIPYTSIIEQTSNVYKYGTDDTNRISEQRKTGKCLFGEENVLEHHSNFDFEGLEKSEILMKHKLSSENWDAPIIVTTNVQLFESLFNAHSSHCRKLHNLANSVIIIDEAQMLPPDFLKSIISVLKCLVEEFGATVVLSTATQPALCGKIGSNSAIFEGIPTEMVSQIIDNPNELSIQFNRVKINFDLVKNKVSEWSEIANLLNKYDQVLCIVQTRRDCRNLHRLMPKGTIHLSALMCAEERSEVISDIKRKLKNGEPIRVISTQLVECGVDIDFPVVFKALSGLDSIAQAAGRCNREGKMKSLGKVFVFDSPSIIPEGLLKKGAEATREILEKYKYCIELTPQVYSEYFKLFFSKVNNFDKPNFQGTMLDASKLFILPW